MEENNKVEDKYSRVSLSDKIAFRLSLLASILIMYYSIGIPQH